VKKLIMILMFFLLIGGLVADSAFATPDYDLGSYWKLSSDTATFYKNQQWDHSLALGVYTLDDYSTPDFDAAVYTELITDTTNYAELTADDLDGGIFGFYVYDYDTNEYWYSDTRGNDNGEGAIRFKYLTKDYDTWLLSYPDWNMNGVKLEVYADNVVIPNPEPATLLLFGAGMLGAAAIRRKKMAM